MKEARNKPYGCLAERTPSAKVLRLVWLDQSKEGIVMRDTIAAVAQSVWARMLRLLKAIVETLTLTLNQKRRHWGHGNNMI